MPFQSKPFSFSKRLFFLSGCAAGDFPAVRARAHISARSRAVDYAAAAAVDYDAAHLWITHLSVLWISRFAGRAELARYTLCVPNEPGALV